MTDIAPIILSLATLITALGGALVSWRNSKGIEVIHKATNSMKDELVAEVRAAATLAGEKIGAAEEKARSTTP